MGRSLAALVVVGAITVAPAALADCTCRGRDGTAVELGGTICLTTTEGPRLARCEMVQNVSSWRTTQDSCPMARFSPVGSPVVLGAVDAGRVAALARIPNDAAGLSGLH